MNKNHAISTRRVKPGHYQVVLTNVQSGKCLKVFCDMIREPEMTDCEFERYCEGAYQGVVNPAAVESWMRIKMTDFSHLHALEERAVNIQRSMIAAKKDVQWRSLAVQLFQTEQEIADERTFLELEDMSMDDLYAALFEEAESEVVREVTAIANAAEQAEQIRTAAEALVLKLKDFEYEEWAGNPEISFADFVEVELTALKEALSRGWLSRGKADKPLWEKHKEQERQALIAALDERSRLDPDAPTTIVFKESSDSEQLRNTQTALRNLYKAVQKSRAVNDPLGMATAMEEAGKWF